MGDRAEGGAEAVTTQPPELARRVVFAPDSFKGTVDAADVARLLAEGWREVDPDVDAVLRPMADGGEGTLDAFASAVPGARRIPVLVEAPTAGRRAVLAEWLLLPPDAECPGGTGVVELASTAGIGFSGAASIRGAPTQEGSAKQSPQRWTTVCRGSYSELDRAVRQTVVSVCWKLLGHE